MFNFLDQIKFKYWMLFLFFIICGFIFFTLIEGNKFQKNEDVIKNLKIENINLKQQLLVLNTSYKNCNDIKFADENIFDYIKCINQPQTPTCKSTGSGDNMCRSRQINCNHYKLLLENDPVSVMRLKLATNKFGETQLTSN